MHVVVDALSWCFLLGGGGFLLISGVGVLRMPDLFTRIHAAGMADTMGAGMVLVGLMLQGGFSLATVKLLLILGFLWFSSPVSSYALARATLAGGQEPYWVDELEIPPTARIPGRPAPASPSEEG